MGFLEAWILACGPKDKRADLSREWERCGWRQLSLVGFRIWSLFGHACYEQVSGTGLPPVILTSDSLGIIER